MSHVSMTHFSVFLSLSLDFYGKLSDSVLSTGPKGKNI